MQKWEYKMENVNDNPNLICELINEIGEEGWELTALWNNLAYFKRPLADKELIADASKKVESPQKKQWVPKDRERYFFVDDYLDIDTSCPCVENETERNHIRVGNFFRTEAEAIEYRDKIKKMLNERFL